MRFILPAMCHATFLAWATALRWSADAPSCCALMKRTSTGTQTFCLGILASLTPDFSSTTPIVIQDTANTMGETRAKRGREKAANSSDDEFQPEPSSKSEDNDSLLYFEPPSDDDDQPSERRKSKPPKKRTRRLRDAPVPTKVPDMHLLRLQRPKKPPFRPNGLLLSQASLS